MPQPNVIVVICDDLCPGDLGDSGNPLARTPHLDRMHGESVRFSRFTAWPMCTPSRAALLTGLYPQRTRAIDVVSGRARIDGSARTLAHILSDAGYATGAFGKWHLGDTYPCRAEHMGFGEALVHNYGGIGLPGDMRENADRGGEAYWDPVLRRNGIAQEQRGFCTDVIFEAALEFIARCDGRPYFAYIAPNAPHSPLQVDDALVEPYRRLGAPEAHARIHALVETIDTNMGRLLDAASGDTIVLFTSDHGPCPSSAEPTLPEGERMRFNIGLRARKGTLYEGGVRVPAYWWRPGRLDPRDVDSLSSHLDVTPTLASMCRAAAGGLDGIDLSGVLAGGPAPQRAIVVQYSTDNAPVRGRGAAVITQRHKLVQTHEDNPRELYDLVDDPGETTDLSTTLPDVADALHAIYDAWFDRTAVRDDWSVPAALGHEDVTSLGRGELRMSDVSFAEQLTTYQDGTGDGWWDVIAEQDTTFDVDVRIHPLRHIARSAKPAGRVTLQIAGAEYRMPAAYGCTYYRFSGITVPAGRHELRAWHGEDDDRRLARYVDLCATAT